MTILDQKGRNSKAKDVRDAEGLVRLYWPTVHDRAVAEFIDGSVSATSCIRCPSAPCMYLHDEETRLEVFGDFPADGMPDVCPTGAIEWGSESAAPEVVVGKCIGCGLCLNRCPVRAISLTREFHARIHDDDTSHFKESQSEVEQKEIDRVTRIFSGSREEGYPVAESDELLLHIFESLCRISNPNLLVRNAMMQIGWRSVMRRRGDVNIRIDIVAEGPGGQKCVVEVQPSSSAMIEAPRDMLDDIAVLVGRYRQDAASLVPVVVTHQLPSQRSEYWQILEDIREVLQISIQTVTTVTLLMLVWARVKVDFTTHRFDVDSSNRSLKATLETLLSRPLETDDDRLGIIKPQK